MNEENGTNTLKNERLAGKLALKKLLTPIHGRLNIARLLAAISGALTTVPYIALVLLGRLFIKAAAQHQSIDAHQAWLIVNILISTFAARLVIYFVALLITHFADIKIGFLIRQRMIDRLSHAPLGWFTDTNSGKIRKALQDDIVEIHALVAHQPVDPVVATVSPLVLLAYAFIIDWRLGLLSIATFPIYMGVMSIMMKGMGEKTVEMDSKLGAVSATMVEFVSGISVVKAFGTVGKAHHQYQKAANDFAKFYLAWVKPMLRSSVLGYITVMPAVLLLVNLGGGTAMVAAGWVSPVAVLATTLISLVIPQSITALSNSAWSYQIAGAAALRIEKTLATPLIEETKHPMHPKDNEVVYDNISFAYNDDSLAIEDVNFCLKPNTVTALIGPSGSGKSTVATLLARFADPQCGRITLGGVDIRSISSSELYKNIAFVLQDPQLLGISIRDNIALGRPQATEKEIRKAAEDAQILNEIEKLPNGFDTVYDAEQGLSGGQAQRVVIARALLMNAPILILDEATASADPDSEADIQKALNRLVYGRTVLVIAHRPESVAGADQIIVMVNGRIVSKGTHNQLISDPHYQKLWQSASLGTQQLMKEGAVK